MDTKKLQDQGLTEAQIAFVMAEYGRDVAAEQTKVKQAEDALATITAERDTAQGQLAEVETKLKSFEGKDFDALRVANAQLLKDMEQLKADNDKELTKVKLHADTREFLGGHKFVNAMTAAHFEREINAALEDPSNAGKSREQLFAAMTKGEGDDPMPGIFVDESAPAVVIPPVGDAPSTAATTTHPTVI